MLWALSYVVGASCRIDLNCFSSKPRTLTVVSTIWGIQHNDSKGWEMKEGASGTKLNQP